MNNKPIYTPPSATPIVTIATDILAASNGIGADMGENNGEWLEEEE